MKKYFTLFTLIIFLGCLENSVEEIIPCETHDLGVSSESNVVYYHPNPLFGVWLGEYSDEYVVIKFTNEHGFHGDRTTFTFKFKKINGCLEFIDAYRLFRSYYDPTFVSHLDVSDVKIQEWIVDSHLSGEITFENQGQPVTQKFWVEFTPDAIYEEPIYTQSFEGCIGTELPMKIDLNNDNVDDFSIDFSVYESDSTIPFKVFDVSFQSFDQNNIILARSTSFATSSLLFNSGSSSDSGQASQPHDRSLFYYIDFARGYKQYNSWVSGPYLHTDFTLDRYIIVKMNLNGQDYYGRIKIYFDALSCTLYIEFCNYILRSVRRFVLQPKR